MSGIEYLIQGFQVALAPTNLLACLVGVVLGTMVGVLPGLGPIEAMAIMLPLSIRYGPLAGLILLAGVWYGAQYGGSTTSILVNIPGEASSVITCIDGYQMTRKGRAGAALTISAIGSFVAGTIGIIILQLFAPPLARAALSFGPLEYLAVMLLAFVALCTLSGDNPLKGALMIALGDSNYDVWNQFYSCGRRAVWDRRGDSYCPEPLCPVTCKIHSLERALSKS
jgi:putative tricarboxylic transport membrane protein